MLRSRSLLALLSFAALLVVPASSSAAGWHTWTGAPTDVFRTGQYSAGEWVYTNGLRQARGANTDLLERSDYFAAVKPSPVDPTSISYDLYNAFTYDFFGSHRAAHNGDFQLPDSLPAGTGEVAEVRLAIEGGDLYVRFLWNAFPKPDAQIATLTFGDGPVTAWPRNAKLSGGSAAALTVWGTGGSLVRGSVVTPVATRTGNHTSEARIPLSLLPAGPWTLRGGSGLTDPADRTRYWTLPAGFATASSPGSGGPLAPTNVWDLLFAGDSPWSFDELNQSRQLSAGVATASATVDLNHRHPLAALQHGDFSRLLHSALPSKDGISKSPGALPLPQIKPPIPVPDFNVNYYYQGALQDYAMHVPTSYDGSRATPLVVYLHGITGLPEEPFRNPTGLVQAIDKRGWLLASALGRGDYFYQGGTPGDADVMEVIADVRRRYHVDPDRIYLMGHSMGGYGTNNVAMHHPDLFAAVAPAEGTGSPELHANLRNTPWFMMTAEEDLDVQAKAAKALYASLSATGYDATLLDYSLKTHEYSSIYDTLPRLLGFFASHKRATRPAVVSWTRPVGQDRPALHEKYDGAWWLRDVQPAPGIALPTVTVESMAIPHIAPGPGTTSDRMVDEGGPTGRTGARLLQTVPSRKPAAVEPNTLKVSATGARSARVVLADAGLLHRPQLVIRSVVSHALTLLLTGEARRLQRTVDGKAGGIVQGSVVLPKGSHTVVLTPVTTAATGGGLAATGGLPWAAVGAASLALGLLLRRRRVRRS
ncbi:MAG: putative esterase [Frankiales bacterium]|nr:putative esterase [Frankiales bacterium]